MSAQITFLLQALLVIGLPYGVWRLVGRSILMPLVVVQILVGLALGPSGLGQILPGLQSVLFPSASLPVLNGLVWLGVVWFAFATGLHLDDAQVKSLKLAQCGLLSVILPVGVGVGAGWAILLLVPQAKGAGVPDWAFIIAVGIAVGVTALPVLAAILGEMGLSGHPIGQLALGVAAVNDGALWLMVAVLLALLGNAGTGGALSVLLAAGLWALGLWVAVRPLMAGLVGRIPGQAAVVVLSVGLLASALVTEAIGLHSVIGAFAFGLVVPRAAAAQLVTRFEPFLMVVLLPFFFMTTGLSTDLAGADGAGLVFALTLAASVLSKWVAGLGLAHCQGWDIRQGTRLGALIGCKGLMELVVLTLFLERGIIAPAGFSGMVAMALVATALARPVAQMLDQPAGRA